jgi:hypothetical protein
MTLSLETILRIRITLSPRPVVVTATVTRTSGPVVYVTPHSGRWAGRGVEAGTRL